MVDIRKYLLSGLAALPGDRGVLAWQRSLADALIRAELNEEKHDSDEIRQHRHLLRLIGDGLVYTLLPSHTIRTLSRESAVPAGIASQGENFDFVFSCAEHMMNIGLVPIIADLTTLVGIGDVVGWNDSGIVVLECKNRSMPSRISTTGRLARQRKRGEDAAAYLTKSRLASEDGSVRVAFNLDLPAPSWEALETAISAALSSDAGLALHSLGEQDQLLVCVPNLSNLDELDSVLSKNDLYEIPMLASLADSVDSNDYRVWPPTAYPFSADIRSELIEGNLMIFRLLDLAKIGADFIHDDEPCALVPRISEEGVYIDLVANSADNVSFTPALTRYVMLMPVSVDEMRNALVRCARLVLTTLRTDSSMDVFLESAASDTQGTDDGEGNTSLRPAAGDNFAYATAYRNADGSPTIQMLP